MNRYIFFTFAALWICFSTCEAYHTGTGDPSWCYLKDYPKDPYCQSAVFRQYCPVKCGGSSEGQWGAWTHWQACSKDCDGTTTRYRTCVHLGSTNGCKTASGAFQTHAQTETKNCDRPGADCRVPVNGNWAHWSSWSKCSVSCGNGQRFRTRSCSNPAAMHGGKSCTRMDGTEDQKEETQNEICIRDPCPIDGKYTEWSTWTECSATCGPGQRHRKRCCSNPAPQHGGKQCEGGSIISKPCDTAPCPVDGNWAQWTQWTACDVTCGFVGVRKRERTCTNPPASFGGKICPGLGMETAVCGRVGCPVDGGFSAYSDWSKCSDDCNGVQYRARSCDSPAAINGGKPCTGETAELRVCKGDPDSCPIAPNIETSIISSATAPSDNTKVSDISLINREYIVEGHLVIANLSDAVAGNIFTFETADTFMKGVAGPAIDLFESSGSLYLDIHTNINKQAFTYSTADALTNETTFKIQQYLENGEYQRRIFINQAEVDKRTNPQPVETRLAHVYASNGTAATGITIENFKFVNSENRVCPTKADVLYILDTSTNVIPKMTETKDFMIQMARAFPITTAPSSRGAVMTFNDGAELQIRLRDPTSATQFYTAFQAITAYNGGSDQSLARINATLELARDNVFLPELGDQVDVPNLVIMFLESSQAGQTPGDATPKMIADQMRGKNIKIFIVAVDNNISDQELKDISGGDYNYLRAASWDELANEEFVGAALDMACRVLTDGTSISFA